MSVVIKEGHHYCFGERLLDVYFYLLPEVMVDNQVRIMKQGDRQKILALQDAWGTEALRVLAFAYRQLDHQDLQVKDQHLEQDLTF